MVIPSEGGKKFYTSQKTVSPENIFFFTNKNGIYTRVQLQRTGRSIGKIKGRGLDLRSFLPTTHPPKDLKRTKSELENRKGGEGKTGTPTGSSKGMLGTRIDLRAKNNLIAYPT